MKHLLQSITEKVDHESMGVRCENNQLGLQHDLFLDIHTIVNGAMVDEVCSTIFNKIINDSIDLTRLVSVQPKNTDVREIIDIAKTLKTKYMFVSGEVFMYMLYHFRSTVSTDFKERTVGSYSSCIDIKSGGSKLTVHRSPQLGWVDEFIHFTNPIELDREFSEYMKFTHDDKKYELILDPMKMPTSYKIKICS